MKRSIIRKAIMILVTGLLVFPAAAAFAADKVELKLAHFMPPMHIQHRESFVPFAEKVAELSQGEVTVKIYPGGQLGGPKQLYDAVVSGIADMAFIIPSYVTGRFPRTSVFELPYLFDSGVHQTKVAYDLYDEYFAEDFKDVKVLWMYGPGLGQFHSVNKPILKASDLIGVKMRSPNAPMTMALTALGANPVGMPVSKLYVSLEKGIIDGVLTPYSAITDFKLFDLIKHVSEVNMYATLMAVIMNKKKFDSLSEAGQKAIEDASGKQWGLHAAEIYLQHDMNTIEEIKAKGKIQLHKIAPEEKAAMEEKLEGLTVDWIGKVSKKGIDGEKIVEAVKASAQRTR